ncbi:MAG: 6-phosphofructokinase [bacterium]
MAQKKILLFTGGGLAPALNATLFGAISAAKQHGYSVWGGFSGWKSLLPKGQLIDLSDLDITPIKRAGGTFLRSSRTNPYGDKKNIEQIIQKISKEKFNAVIPIGGDDTLGAAERLFREEGISTIGIPKTIDNDLPGTYWTPGHPTAAKTLSDMVHEIRFDAAYPLQRVFIIESYGMDAGWLAASTSYGHADIIIPPEKEVDLDNFFEIYQNRLKNNGGFAVIVVSEHARFSGGVEGECFEESDTFQRARRHLAAVGLRKEIKNKFGQDMRIILPGNFIQTGPPSSIDGDIAEQLGEQAINMLNNELFGQMACVQRPDLKSNKVTTGNIPLSDVISGGNVKTLTDELFDFENLQVKPAYLDYMEPILGKLKDPDNHYARLLQKIKTV